MSATTVYLSEASSVSMPASHSRHLPSAILTPQGAPTLPLSQSSSEGLRIGLHSSQEVAAIQVLLCTATWLQWCSPSSATDHLRRVCKASCLQVVFHSTCLRVSYERSLPGVALPARPPILADCDANGPAVGIVNSLIEHYKPAGRGAQTMRMLSKASRPTVSRWRIQSCRFLNKGHVAVKSCGMQTGSQCTQSCNASGFVGRSLLSTRTHCLLSKSLTTLDAATPRLSNPSGCPVPAKMGPRFCHLKASGEVARPTQSSCLMASKEW